MSIWERLRQINELEVLNAISRTTGYQAAK